MKRSESDTLIGYVTPGAPDPAGITGSGPVRVAHRYEVLALLGVGGMGSVYRVRDMELDEIVALKLLRRELPSDLTARFRQEVKLARRIAHPNVIRTFDLGEHGDERFLTMEYIEGRSLAQQLADGGALPPSEVIRIGRAIADGVTAAHKASVLHRDLKPDNVMIASDGRVVVTDFGIARPADAGRTLGGVMGTPAYMAPEQVRGGVLDGRVDLYAIGAILFEMLTGRRAWPGEQAFAVALARLDAPAPDPRELTSVPDVLAEITMRCLSPRPEDRFPSASALASAFDRPFPCPAPSRSPRPVPAMPAPSARTVAVLPLRSGSPEDAWLAEGITEELIDALSTTRGLRVRPLGAVLRVAGEPDPQAVGKLLEVDVVVEGAVRRAGSRIRTSVRVISVADGFQLWARRFESGDDDLLSVSDEAARAVAHVLTTQIESPQRAGGADPVAVELYLRGRQQMRRSWEKDPGAALALFEQALARAPDDANLLACYAQVRARQAFYGIGEDAGTHLPAGRAAAERAVTAAPELAEPWIALATVQLYGGDAVAAARAALRAARHAPGHVRAQELLGSLLLEAGRAEAAVAHLEAALALDPESQARIEIARAQAFAGDWEAVSRSLARARTGERDSAATLAELRYAIWRNDPVTDRAVGEPSTGLLARDIATIRQVLLVVGRTRRIPENFRANSRTIVEVPNPRFRSLRAQFSAEITAFGGEPELALGLLEIAVQSGLIDILWMDRCPPLEPLRRLERWPALRAVVAERAARVLEALDQ